MAGVMSLMQGSQGQQGPVPGQAQQQPMPGVMPQQGAATPGAMTGSLKAMNLDQLKMLYQNPQRNGPPLWAVISALAEKQKEDQATQMAQGQQAIAQNAQMQQQPPVAAQVMQAADQMQQPPGYAGGGAVAFAEGGDPEVERILKKGPYERTPEENEILRAAGIGVTRQQGLPEGGFLSRINKGLESLIGRTAPVPEETASYDHEGRMGLTSKPVPPARPPAPAPMQPTRRPPAGNKPPVMSQGLGGLMSGVEQTGTPAPDTLSDIESGGIRDIKALQDVIRQQGTVDPRLAELREAAYKSSQGIAERRERDRLAALEAAQKQYADPTDLLIGLAGGAGGRTALDVLRGAVSGAGAARTAKRADLQKAQEVSRQEQNAIDTLNQALADKRVADMTGDVNQRREADRKVAEAQLKVTDLRSGIQKERAAEEDRKEQREIGRRTAGAQEKSAEAAMIGAKARAAGVGERGAITPRDIARFRAQAEKDVDGQLKADPNYVSMKVRDPVKAEAYRTRTIDERLKRVLADEGFGETAPASAAGPVYNFADIGKK